MQNLPNAEEFYKMCQMAGIKSCWLWTGKTDSDGYGIMYYKGKQLKAHRVAYMLTTQRPIPRGHCISHHCVNKLCVNPHHLHVTTPSGRGHSGEHNGRSKLTKETVAAIMRRYNAGETLTALAAEYGVATSTLSRAVRKRTWSRKL